jgi:hypothetical protein
MQQFCAKGVPKGLMRESYQASFIKRHAAPAVASYFRENSDDIQSA